jgi:outer membrane protein assembly factor BamB
MKWRMISVLSALLVAAAVANNLPWHDSWPQWAQNSQHTGFVQIAGQSPNHKLAEIRYDPFVPLEKADWFGALAVHYQVPLIEGNSVYMEFKTGKWIACHPPTAWTQGAHCGPNAWESQTWNEKRMDWQNGKLIEVWNFKTDWKPEPNASPGGALGGWEPVFHPLLTRDFLYVPGFGGTIWKVDKTNGRALSQINPFGATIERHTFVSGPLAADAHGNVYYNAVKLDASQPWRSDVRSAWLVKVLPDDTSVVATFADLVPGAPKGTSHHCPSTFFDPKTLPWPPSRHSKPQTTLCGSQRPPINVAPAISAEGTIYTFSVAHFDFMVSYLVAVNPDLTPKWQASLQKRLHDGCGFLVPIAKHPRQPDACRKGANLGVDPNTNEWGSGLFYDFTSSTPTILPDGSILVDAETDYNAQRGHMMKFSPGGKFLASYDFGYDETPAVYPHDGTYSIVIKDNHYPGPLYCYFNNPACKNLPPGQYDVTQLNADLKPEWKFANTTIDKKHPTGYEWCINAPAFDKNGVVYANSEDGDLYVLNQGGTLKGKIFLRRAIGAAYTPLSLGPDGRIYTQNDGVLLVVGQ